MKLGVKRDCCPLCGGRIIVSELCQYSMNYVVLKKPSGKLSKKFKKVDNGPIECIVAGCENPNCEAHWEEGEFYIDSWDYFVDEKYVEETE